MDHCGCQELNSGPLEKQYMLLTTEPSLQAAPKILSHNGDTRDTELQYAAQTGPQKSLVQAGNLYPVRSQKMLPSVEGMSI